MERSSDPLPNAMASIDELAERVQSLPPEIYKEVYDLTFTPRSNYHRINAAFKPSKLLAVDRASRAIFAVRYYRENAIFSLQYLALGRQWLVSLPQRHLQLLRIIRCDYGSSFSEFKGKETAKEWKQYTAEFSKFHRGRIDELNRALSREAIYVWVAYDEDKKEKWIGNTESLSKLRPSLLKAGKLGARPSEESRGSEPGGLVVR